LDSSALVCDIDAVRGLNDRYGHEAGDRALIDFAEVVEESIGRRAAIIGRQGGDEFVILLPGVDLDEATMIAERLCEACEARALIKRLMDLPMAWPDQWSALGLRAPAER
jgi:diguanylate cyclase (GGDEF)-like protein